MATGKDPGEQKEMSDLEVEQLKAAFTAMGARPKADTKEDLQRWLLEYAASFQAPAAPGTPAATASAPATTVVEVSGRKPWLVKFSGDSGPEGYDLWKHQLTSLQREGHPTKDIFDAIRSSLHGKAGHIMVRLGTDATVADILKKMNSVFGEVDTEADVLASFYSARQGTEESVADWGCRLESLYDLAKRQAQLPGTQDEALRTMFWSGLRQDLKDVSSYQYDVTKTFDELRTVLRRIEKQHGKPQVEKEKTASCKMSQPKVKKDDRMDKLEAVIQQLTTEIKNLKTERQSNETERNQQESWTQGRGHYQRSSSRGRGGQSFQRGERQYSDQQQDEVVCWRCGEKGHVRAGCRMRIDHLHKKDF